MTITPNEGNKLVTNNSNNGSDDIWAILQQVAEQQRTFQEQQQLAFQEWQRDMREQQLAFQEEQRATQRLVDANARAIAELRDLFARQSSETVRWFADVVNQADEDRKLIVGLQTEGRRILEELQSHRRAGHGA